MKKKILVSLVCFILIFNSFSIPVYANEDYLSISLADIVITYFNATGVAIGETELFNAIQDLWGNVTLSDLVDNDVLVAEGVNWTKDDVRNMIGYGNLSVPFVKVNQRNLKNYLGEVPISNVAHDALDAMFSFDSPVTDGIFTALAIILGDVANIGRMGYDLVSEVVLGFTDIFPIRTLKQAYQKFTDSTYFQDLLNTGSSNPDYNYQYNFDWTGYDGVGLILQRDRPGFVCKLYEHVFPIQFRIRRNGSNIIIINNSDETVTIEGAFTDSSFPVNIGSWESFTINAHSYYPVNYYSAIDAVLPLSVDGYALVQSDVAFTESEAFTYGVENDPWGQAGSGGGGSGNGVTNYINNQVGNIASDNYINLNPNIGTKEYINIFDRIAYIENLNQIENNTDNGDYSQNSTVINNYNNQYIQNTIPTARPSTAPAQNPDEQPAQPFVSPRPTQTPEFVESVVQEGGLSSEITTKFPFCIPWDIKALIDNLWAPEARAPYIHWDAEFGSWGKLGEVDIDLSEYDDVARIFRSTTLLLWIVGLIVLTRNMIG